MERGLQIGIILPIMRSQNIPLALLEIYHWNTPLALYKKGSWSNPESPVWFEKYAQVIFENFGSRSYYFLTFNEPEGYVFTQEPLAANLIDKKLDGYRYVLSVVSRGK
ncbi:TPA: family 1 glycosylhydrolase [Escherichia coli]|nr:family 1 glycosylhydrolase [Escherichia coli]HBN0282182.1 family 1 glycosylhydrolase [Escherichia coli]HCL7457390.1 family 1 glycosylhydrolase [Escherichia coli]HDV1993105.1 family 1 glycosylhydrolase [Escherichia coli]HDV3135506.1 family 1 glycosylhydrolase [Escherichia coli]